MSNVKLSAVSTTLVVAVLMAFGACSSPQASKARASASAVNTGGVDMAGMDRAVNPGDDFFGYANGAWIKATEIPPDRSSYGLDARLAEEAILRTRNLLEDAAKGAAPAGSDERKAGDYYAAFMDEAAIESKGLEPIRSQLDRIAAISNRRALAQSLAQTIRADVDPLNNTNLHTEHLFGVWVTQDFNEPTRYAPYLLQGGIGMPDREYYLSSSPHMAEIRT